MTTKTKKKITKAKLPTIKKKAPKEDLRVQIAKDVIAQIKVGKYTAKESYGYLSLLKNSIEFNPNETSDLQKTVAPPDITCKVCALGATMVSYARLKDKVLVCDGQSPHGSKELKEIFGTEQMGLIEVAFERDAGCMDLSDNKETNDYYDSLNKASGSIQTTTDVVSKLLENAVITLEEYDETVNFKLLKEKAENALKKLFASKEIKNFSKKKKPDFAEKAEKFGMKYKDENKRLVAIMNNIIRNKGVFKP